MRNLRQILHLIVMLGLVALLGAGCTKQAKKAYHLRKASNYYAAGEYDKAEIEYIKALRNVPQNILAFQRLGLIYAEQGRSLRALQFLGAAKGMDTNNLEVRLKLGLVCLPLGGFREAHDEASFILDRAPTNQEAMLLLAFSSASTNDLVLSRQRLQKLIQQHGDTAGAQAALGNLSLKQGDLKAAEAAYQRALSLDSKCSAAYLGLGDVHLLRKDQKLAEESYRMGAGLAPLRSMRRLSYARFKTESATNAAVQAGALDELKKLLQEVLARAPDSMPALRLLAQIHLAEKKFDDCAAVLQRVLAREPTDYEGLSLDGRLKMAQGRADLASAVYSRLTEWYDKMGPPFSPPYYDLALMQLANNEQTKAAESLNRALASARGLAVRQIPTNQLAKSTNIISRILALNPVYSDATVLLAELNTKRGDSAAAVRSLSQWIQGLQQAMESGKELREDERRQLDALVTPKLVQAHLLLANAYSTQGKPAEALAACDRCTQLSAKDPRPHFFAGRILRVEKKGAEARRAFEKALEMTPDTALADKALLIEQLAQMDMEEKQAALALQRVQAAIEKDPKRAGLKLLLAQVYVAQGNTNQAEATLQKVIEEDPNSQIAYSMLADLNIAAGKQVKALQELQTLLSKNPSNAPALWTKGMILESQKDYTAALKAYEDLLKIAPKFSLALNNAAYLYAEQFGNLDRAYELAQKARDSDPTNSLAADTLGWILLKRGEYPRALSLLKESADKLPEQPEVLFHLGMAHYMMLDEGSARLALQKALQMNKDFPGKPEAEKRLVVLSLDAGTTKASAIPDLKALLAKTPDDPIVLVRLARLYEQSGAVNEARDAYEKTLQRNPNSAAITIRLAQLYAERLQDPKRALELAKAARTLAPDDANVAYLLGRLACQSGDQQWGLGLLQESSRKLPNQPEVWYDLGVASYHVGRSADAETAISKALQLNPSFPRAAAARRFLEVLNLCKDPAVLAKSAAQLQQALKADPELLPALFATGLLQEQRGDLAAATQTYESLLARNPQFSPAIRQQALLLAQNPANDKKAYDLAGRARDAFPQDTEVAKAIGVLAYRRGDFSRAAQLLAESSTKRTNDAEVFYYLGMARYNLSKTQKGPQQKKESADALAKAIAMGLKAPLADEAKKVLALLK